MSEEDYKLEISPEALPPTDVAIEAEVPAEPVISEVEQKARAQGWRPPEEFNEEGKEAVSAEEYLRRAPLFDKLDKLKSQYRNDTHQLREEIKELKRVVNEERNRGYEQALMDLAAKRDEAVEIGDLDTFKYLDAEYDRIKSQRHQYQDAPVVESPASNPDVIAFVDRNQDWFNDSSSENIAMKNQAIRIEEHLIASEPYLTDAQRFKIVEDKIKGLYAHRFENHKRNQPARVETQAVADVPSSSAKSKGPKLKYSDLSDRQKEVCEQFLSLDPRATVEDYLLGLEESLKMRRQL